MLPLFDVIFVQDPKEATLLQSYLEWKGFSASESREKIWKEEQSEILLFRKFSPSLAEDLLDFQKSILLFGSFSPEVLDPLLQKGIAMHWKWGATRLFSLPLYRYQSYTWNWLVQSGDPLWDLAVRTFLRSIGHLVSCEVDFPSFFQRLGQQSIDVAILNWDNLNTPLPEVISKLLSLKTKTVFLGLKDFDKQNLFRELSYGIQSISPLLFTKRNLLLSLVESLPILGIESPSVAPTQRKQTLVFEMQEKNKPMRVTLDEVSVESLDIEKNQSPLYFRELFRSLERLSFKL